MAFSVSQIINKFLAIKPHSSSADGWENPFGTGAGQLVVSNQENWQTRLARQGSMRSMYSSKTNAPTAGGQSGVLAIRAPKGTQCFVTHATISANGPGLADMMFAIGNDLFLYRKYITGTTGGSFEVKFDGAIMLRNGSDFSFAFTPDNANTTFTGSCIWMEVQE